MTQHRGVRRGQITFLILSLTAVVGAAPGGSSVADAAMRGDRAAVRTLLKQGADANAGRGDGMTALHFAAERGDVTPRPLP